MSGEWHKTVAAMAPCPKRQSYLEMTFQLREDRSGLRIIHLPYHGIFMISTRAILDCLFDRGSFFTDRGAKN